MNFDALTLAAVRDEIEPLLIGTRIQKLIFVDERSLAIEVFAPHLGRTNLLLSADLEQGRIQRLAHLPARGLERDTPFSLVARKHLRNAHIRAVHQPRLERVFELDCEQRDVSGQHYRVRLIVEAMGRRSNLVLVGADGLILDAARRSPPSRNARRPVLPHLPYEPPPPQSRLMPEQITPDALAEDAPAVGRLAKYLPERIAGLSPLASRELTFRTTGGPDTDLAAVDWLQVAEGARTFVGMADRHAWRPNVAFETEHPLAFAPYELRHLAANGARLEAMESISGAIETYYARLSEVGPARRGDALAAERRALLAPLERAAETTARRIAALELQLQHGQSRQGPLRRAGELIVTHLEELPLGSSELVVADERFELDPALSPIENSQAYFARYRKAREAKERVPVLLEEARQRALHLADLSTLVEIADGMDSVRALRREVGAATGLVEKSSLKTRKQRPSTKAASGPHRRISLGGGWEALVGASAAGNASVTFDLAQADDLWLHARGMSGAHVILRTNGAVPPDGVIERAAQLAAWHSAGRASGALEVDVTPRRHVKKIPNGPPGLVRYAHERTVRVTPQP